MTTLFALIPTLILSLVPLARAPFASLDEAATLQASGALMLDARAQSAFRAGHIVGAVGIDWKDFRASWGRTGKMSDDDIGLAKNLVRLGVDDNRPIVVYGDVTKGFGEEGRIAWMLMFLGHDKVQVLDGGWEAWRAAGKPVQTGVAIVPKQGHFTIHRRPAIRAVLKEVSAADKAGAPAILDVRTVEEWNGKTPYLEARGGHIPSAKFIAWTAFFDKQGKLLPHDEIVAALDAAGIKPKKPIIVYCTGGVRSAMVWTILRSLGYDAKNYDASFWEWAREKTLPVTVEPK